MQSLTVTAVQSELHWHDPEKNREQFTRIIRSIDEQTDLIVLPEMFTTGFTMDAATNAERMDGPSIEWMKEMARSANASL